MVHKEFVKAKKILTELYFHLLNDNERLEKEMINMKMAAPDDTMEDESRERTVCDLISSMTDRYAMNLYKKLFFPSPTF